MVRIVGIFLISYFIYSCNSAVPKNVPDEIQSFDQLALIPYPQSIQKGEGYFELNESFSVEYETNLSNEGKYLENLIYEAFISPSIDHKASSKIKLEINPDFSDTISHKEVYSLNITPNEVIIQARANQGIMRGIQTLRQLFVPSFNKKEKRNNWYLPTLTITDKPKFDHRGLLLDVCRHFFDYNVVLKYIDALSFYKMNVLHLHLTEDQGWRIPIEKYPLLTEIGAWRTDTSGNKYGGFYTKEELETIVSYAAERHITVIPEIELPGHSQAALAAYPNLSCEGGPIEVVNDWGVFKEIYCAGNDSTFVFLEDILTEVMQIFPSEYIHIGGDEAPKFRWEHCDKCQRRMTDEGLHSEHELQSYFIKRIERFLNKNGRKLIGWDEILEGGLSENATVQSWRGFDGGIEAARDKHQVIMSPTSHCYLDYGLSKIDLQKIYSFDPIPENLESQFHSYIIGGECNMWTEHVPNETNLDSKVFPRMIGLAEVLWSYPNEQNTTGNTEFEQDTNQYRRFNDFYKRIQTHYPILDAMKIAYGFESIGAEIHQKFGGDQLEISLVSKLDNLDLKYKWGNADYKTYLGNIDFKESGNLVIQAYKNNIPYGIPIEQVFEFHSGLNKTVSYSSSYNEWYVANEKFALVDGKLGSLDFRDGNWQGFWGEHLDVIVDLEDSQKIEHVSANFYQYANSWIFVPTEVEVLLSEDGEIWHHSLKQTYSEVDLSNQQRIQNVTFNLKNEKPFTARYIRFKARNLGKVPAGHEAAGSDAWIFIDEIMIN